MACCGMLVASMAKLTGFLLAGGFLATLCALMIWRRTTSKMDVAIIASSLIVAAAPYLAFVLQYGTPAPNTPAQMDLLREGASVAGLGQRAQVGALCLLPHVPDDVRLGMDAIAASTQ